MMSKKQILIFLLSFLSVSALTGGACLIISPDGKLLKMPLELLNGSVFSSFLIPGIILFVVLGLFPMLPLIGLIKHSENSFLMSFNLFQKMYWAWSFTIYVSTVLIIWLITQIIIIGGFNFIQVLYFVVAFLIIIFALSKENYNYYKIQNN